MSRVIHGAKILTYPAWLAREQRRERWRQRAKTIGAVLAYSLLLSTVGLVIAGLVAGVGL